jgi:TrmH RNA methyltransferase
MKSRKPERPERRPPPRTDEEVVFGYRAGLAALSRRADEVLRVHYAEGMRRAVDDALSGTITQAIDRIETPEERLARIAGSTHHEGLCVVTTPRRFASTGELADVLVDRKGAALALDRVRNPYNIGAMLRSAAFFGIDAALLGSAAPHPALPPDAIRVAEGGVEHLVVARTTDLAETLGRLRGRGVQVFGAESEASAPVFGFAFPRPMVLVLGHEREGLGDRVRAQCDALVSIPGSGAVRSLNVAAAASVLMAEIARAEARDSTRPRR